MGGQLNQETRYQALRVEELASRTEAPPLYSGLARAAARGITRLFANELVVSADGSSVTPIKADRLAFTNRQGYEGFSVPGVRFSYLSAYRHRSHNYLLYDAEALAGASMRKLNDIADSCGTILRRLFKGSPLWDDRANVFRSTPTDLPYDEFVEVLAKVPVPKTEAPLSTELIADYIDRLGGVALRGLTDGDVGPARLERGEPYLFNPKTEALFTRVEDENRMLTVRDKSFILNA